MLVCLCDFKVWKGEAGSLKKLKARGSGPDFGRCELITHLTTQNTVKNKHQ